MGMHEASLAPFVIITYTSIISGTATLYVAMGSYFRIITWTDLVPDSARKSAMFFAGSLL